MNGAGVEVMGEVTSGCGEGAIFTQLSWARREFESKLGFMPYPGTFNLRLEGERWAVLRARLMAAEGVAIIPETGFCEAKCFPVRLAGKITGAVVFPAIDDYPRDKFEILSAIGIRRRLGLQDGEWVGVSVWPEPAQAPAAGTGVPVPVPHEEHRP